MPIPSRPGPYRDAEHYIRPSPEWSEHMLPPRRPGVRRSEHLEATSQALASALWPRLHARYPHVPREQVLPACWSLAALGFSLYDPDEALWALELLGRYGSQVSSLEIREAVRLLGSQADLFLESWVTGLHESTTGTDEFAVAVWEFQACMTLTSEGAERIRTKFGFPLPPPELLERERRDAAQRTQTEDASGDRASSLRHRNRISGHWPR